MKSILRVTPACSDTGERGPHTIKEENFTCVSISLWHKTNDMKSGTHPVTAHLAAPPESLTRDLTRQEGGQAWDVMLSGVIFHVTIPLCS